MPKVFYIFIFFIFSITALPLHAYGGSRALNLDSVCNMSIQADFDTKANDIEQAKKRIELKQALDGIRDIRKKESTVSFSLLFNIKFPESHGMPKEIELLTKIPKIDNELTVLRREALYLKLKAQTKAEQAYYDVLLSNYNLDFVKKHIEESKSAANKVQQQFVLGKAKKADVDFTKKLVTDYERQLEKAVLNEETVKRKLSALVGTNVLFGYTFKEELAFTNLKREELNEIIEFVKNNDFELFKAAQKRALAEKVCDIIMGVYKSAYGSKVNEMEGYIKAREGKQINYNDFLNQYEKTLYQLDEPWYGAYVINLLFFKIRIPKEWFKLQYSGTRYMEDEKYPIFVALVERDKARKEEENAIAEAEEKIRNEFSSLKNIESSITDAEENYTAASTGYNKMLWDNTLGLVKFTDLESAKNNLYQLQKSIYELKLEYTKQLSAFNLSTSGYVNKKLNRYKPPEDSRFASGNTYGEEGTWHIKNNITDYNFIFGVSLPDKYKADSYQLFYNGNPLGERIAIDKELIHLAIAYEDKAVLEARFYFKGEHMYTSIIEGGTFEGPLNLIDANKQDVDKAGTWELIKADDLREMLKITLTKEIDFDSYHLKSKNSLIGIFDKNKSFTSLSLYFYPTSDLELYLMKGDKQVGKLMLLENAKKERLLVHTLAK